jgi:hypothetical protein
MLECPRKKCECVFETEHDLNCHLIQGVCGPIGGIDVDGNVKRVKHYTASHESGSDHEGDDGWPRRDKWYYIWLNMGEEDETEDDAL